VPSLRHGFDAYTPRTRCRDPSALGCQPSVMFRPRGFSPPRRFTPHRNFEHLAARAGQGSLRFLDFQPAHRTPPRTNPDEVLPSSPARTLHDRQCLSQWHTAFPRSAFHTPRRTPLVSSRVTSLHTLPSCRFRSSLHTLPRLDTRLRCARPKPFAVNAWVRHASACACHPKMTDPAPLGARHHESDMVPPFSSDRRRIPTGSTATSRQL